MKDVYEELPKLKVNLTLSKFLVIIFIVTITFVIPASMINYSVYYNNQPKVEGISTQRSITQPNIDFTNQTQILIIIGGILITISIIIIIYLIIDNKYNNGKMKK